ncbi:hypothetical protein [Haliscomenobacter sp.]|uniref:hypothetical protein n=1 Tax=Haliscomenobacter sp. TaxID=2717303 RepID=UPI003364B4B7
MILQIILLISFIQALLYLFAAALRFKPARYFILVAVLIVYFFILPQYFYPEPKPNRVNCGLPILAINMGFWIFGSLAATFTHFLTPIEMWKISRDSMEEHEIIDAKID